MLSLLLLAASAHIASDRQNATHSTVVVADHIGLHVANPELSAEFYQRVLRLKPMRQTISPTMRWLSAGKFELHLLAGRKTAVDSTTDTHIALRVPSIAEQIQILDRNRVAWENAAGAPYKITTRADGVLQIYFKDPDGYQIEVNQAPNQERR